MPDRPRKITFAEMRDMGVRGILVYCADYQCLHSIAISGDAWPDDVRLSDIEARFVCQACGKSGADVRPDFNWNKFIEPDGVSLITFSQTRNPGSCVMRQSPSIVPDDLDRDVYLVLDDFGSRLGRSWRETDEADTDRATLIRHLLEGQYSSPVRVIAFNTAEGWSRDVTEEIAAELAKAWLAMPPSIADFIADHTQSSRVR